MGENEVEIGDADVGSYTTFSNVLCTVPPRGISRGTKSIKCSGVMCLLCLSKGEMDEEFGDT